MGLKSYSEEESEPGPSMKAILTGRLTHLVRFLEAPVKHFSARLPFQNGVQCIPHHNKDRETHTKQLNSKSWAEAILALSIYINRMDKDKIEQEAWEEAQRKPGKMLQGRAF